MIVKLRETLDQVTRHPKTYYSIATDAFSLASIAIAKEQPHGVKRDDFVIKESQRLDFPSQSVIDSVLHVKLPNGYLITQQ